MKKSYERSMIAAAMLAGSLALSGMVQAQETLPVMPQAQTQGDVKFVTGGIGEGQSGALQKASSDYRLALTFAQAGGSGGKGVYLADVPVQIIDAKGATVLSTKTDGPYLLANLPAGEYTVKASADGVEKTQKVKVGASGTTRAVFEWPAGK
ncbi:hypothetical protein CEG14_12320 [Bordetella genomosp. 1]|uniref:Carboxypeptidase regulatory-like domain-containing protein n=1 Tax=Bordetella genomosp. 1 TaxID=1395607 RepID=A0A261SEJ8_9BORD|nr:carboxypeptidase-like regulatory domain-containing protein [Bordetella genomosp. 1]MDQ8031212.1 carboxypeptidase-like regulatory domain-containing protein [Bordetella sp.]OZI35829.1 hypothetical protein CEG14_12320 [Bordetella genomosp. 1]OZI58495.1 hypothetical protein CAL27_17525 [Bordetella genomosp. 1]